MFACTGTYTEAVVISDSISIIGGLDCADPARWKLNAPPSRIQSPTSPAVTAKSVTTATRLESLDIVAPNATAPGASSIGLLADHSPGLTIAKSSITAGSGANGARGAVADQLVLGAAATGGVPTALVDCVESAGSCGWTSVTGFSLQPGANGGVSQCGGAAKSNGAPGGAGGTGGLWQVAADLTTWNYYRNDVNYSQQLGKPGTSANGAPGSDAAPAGELGSLTADGYVPVDGHKGDDGHPGEGGAGGVGANATIIPYSPVRSTGSVVSSRGGGGGGAGGCPGLAGGAGGGGGASIGLALIDSAVALENVAVASGSGGGAGLGSFGSNPTSGGAAGGTIGAFLPPKAGGSGGLPGISTNGANGPSFGILHMGAAPTLTGTSKAKAGQATPAIDAQMTADGRTIPATPAGIAADIKSL